MPQHESVLTPNLRDSELSQRIDSLLEDVPSVGVIEVVVPDLRARVHQVIAKQAATLEIEALTDIEQV